MSRRGSRTSRRSTRSIPTARARSPRPRPSAGSKGEPIGALDGVPVTIKDNIATKGVPVPLGAASVKLVPARADAPPAARLREAGAVIFSKTTMPDYGMLSSGLSSFHPLTRNPWDLSKNPGGSSCRRGRGGAAGYGPLHLGTDIGGSVRLPACWCGLVALKPSLGRVPIDPPYVGRVAGPMTRTVDDAALMMSVLSRPDRRDGMSLPAHDINWKALDKSPRKLRIGLMLDAGVGQALEKAVREVAVKAAKAFESAGAVVTEVDGVLTREMLDGLDNFWRARMWDDLSKLTPAERAKALPYIVKWAEPARSCRASTSIRGFNATMAIRAAAAKLFCELDYVISPVSPVVNFAAELASPINDPDKPFEHICYTVPWNMSENPAVSINGGYDKPTAFRSACRSSAAASTISACSAWPRRSRACAARNGRGRARRRSNDYAVIPGVDAPGSNPDISSFRSHRHRLRRRRSPE